jgi:DNA-binding NarL/FixJ family response regulator
MKQLNPQVAIVILTNHNMRGLREATREYGVDAFISKPAPLEEEIEPALNLSPVAS